MIEEFDIETYLCISPNEFIIYLYDKKNLKNLYKKNFKLNNNTNLIDFNNLDKFLADNSKSSYIVGQSIVIDGGATIKLSTE